MTTTEILQLVTDILNRLHVEFEDVSIIEDSGRIRVAITSPHSHKLIGRDGATLSSLNHIVKRMSEKQGSETPFTVDVNNYYEEMLDGVRNKARVSADRARSFKTNIAMEPMNSYERMIVHSALADLADIKTESAGYGRDRHVVICYTDSPSPEVDPLDAQI
jgi:spoIIIJ-associated protein